jgi:hypothetical protein
MNKFVFFNDTGRTVSIHPATEGHGVKTSSENIEHLQERVFHLPKDTYPIIKMWDYAKYGRGLQILVMTRKDVTE